jgi:exopolyphosphatase/guanosine-5'-triphosphate,3'-diphosphate pyrophosphatase
MSDKIALIDIGSNSVRLVVYDCTCFVPVIIFNERALCALGADLENTGNLSVEGLELAKLALKRFIAIARRCDEIRIFATSAIREARDGKNFAKYIEDSQEVKVDILTAEEEARFSALGVISSVMDAAGVVGDLGGGSLELAEILKGEITSTCSFPIGSLRIQEHNNHQNLSDLLHGFFSQSDLVKKLRGTDFYAVGGGFRTLAKTHIEYVSYPIKILHNYRVPAEELLVSLSRMMSSSIKIPGVGAKRASMIPATAAILAALIEIGEPNKIVFSNYGIREGILFDSLSIRSNKSDLLLACCMDIVGREHLEYSECLHSWLEIFLKDALQQKKRISLAACYLSDLACKHYDKYKARYAFDSVIELPLLCISHESRIFLALILFYRYQSNMSSEFSNIVSLLNVEDAHLAKVLGLAMRLACALSAGLEKVLASSKLAIQNGSLILKVKPEIQDFLGEAVQKRLNILANSLNLVSEVLITSDL